MSIVHTSQKVLLKSQAGVLIKELIFTALFLLEESKQDKEKGFFLSLAK
jgi:hypothetical protein